MSKRRSASERGYGEAWTKASLLFRREHPLCAMCLQAGKVTRANVVDHKVPHRGDMRLFWDRSNWESLCFTHHNSTKQREEGRGHAIGCDEHGIPLNRAHHWHVNRHANGNDAA